MTERTEIDFLFGSDSDKDKIMPGLVRLKEEGLIQPIVHFISADNNSETDVALVIKRVKDRGREHEVYIGGAGLCNQLAGTLRKKARLQDLPIAVPISDSTMKGVSSFLSSSEKPPMSPLPTVGLDNTYAAGNIAYRFLRQPFRGVHVVRRVNSEEESRKIYDQLKKLGIHPSDAANIHPDEVVINPFSSIDQISEIDEILRKGTGVQIAVVTQGGVDIDTYMRALNGTEVTALVNNVKSYANSVYVAAIVIQDKGALAKLAQEREAKAAHLRNLERIVV